VTFFAGVAFLLLILIIIPSSFVYAQTNILNRYIFKIEYEKKQNGRKILSKRDSLYINFDYGYQNDIVVIKARKQIFKSDTLTADKFYGYAGQLRIAKKDLRKKIDIYFNGIFLKRIKVNQRFSSVHLEFNREEMIFTWRYLFYKFSYL
jgi:hypothetical protein